MEARTTIRLIAIARAAFGVALTVRTATLLRMMVRNEEPTGSLFLFARTVGIRDLVLGLGTLAASFGEDTKDLRRWARISFASDAMDIAFGAASAQHVGVSGAIAATVASAPFVAGGLWSLRKLADASPVEA